MRKPVPTVEYYDQLYLSGDKTYEHPRSSRYYPLYQRVCGLVARAGIGSVLEVGCGSGVLANMLIDAGMVYAGFDISPIAIRKAQALNAAGRFFVAGATDPAAYAHPYQGIVCCEVLEHIDADLEAIGLWASGAECVCSVPNFDYESHVRHFRSEREVIERYGRLLDIRHVERVASSARAGIPWSQYFRQIRWARHQPKRMLGMMGLNRFSWYGGWFVFTGQRR